MPLPPLPPADGPEGPKWSAQMPYSTDTYFRRLLMDKGWMQKLVVKLVTDFQKACVAEGIKDYGEPMQREDQLGALLERMNFNVGAQAVPASTQPRPKKKGEK